MRPSDPRPHCGTVAVLATMHGKEQVIASLLEQGLGLRGDFVHGLNTDRIGTFSRDIERTGTPLEAARSKTAAAFDHAPDTRVCVASGVRFGPHPLVPFLSPGNELFLLIDRETGLEPSGQHAGSETNCSYAIVIHDR